MLFRKVLSKIRPIAILTNLYHLWQQQDFSNHRQSNHPVQSNWDLKKERHGTKRSDPPRPSTHPHCSLCRKLLLISIILVLLANTFHGTLRFKLHWMQIEPSLFLSRNRNDSMTSPPGGSVVSANCPNDPKQSYVANTIQALRINCNLVRGGGCTMIDHHPIQFCL